MRTGGILTPPSTSFGAKHQRRPPLAREVTSHWCSLDVAACGKSHLGEDECLPKVLLVCSAPTFQRYKVRKTHLAKNGNGGTLRPVTRTDVLFFTFSHSGFLQMRCVFRGAGRHKRSSSARMSRHHRQGERR